MLLNHFGGLRDSKMKFITEITLAINKMKFNPFTLAAMVCAFQLGAATRSKSEAILFIATVLFLFAFILWLRFEMRNEEPNSPF
jgi:hypothetical protein